MQEILNKVDGAVENKATRGNYSKQKITEEVDETNRRNSENNPTEGINIFFFTVFSLTHVHNIIFVIIKNLFRFFRR